VFLVLDSLSLILPEAEDDFFDLLISLSDFVEQEIAINKSRSEIKFFLIILKTIYVKAIIIFILPKTV
jgi:hypothetical protein